MKRLEVVSLAIALIGVLAIPIAVLAATPVQANNGGGTVTMGLSLNLAYGIEIPLPDPIISPLTYGHTISWASSWKPETGLRPPGTVTVSQYLTIPLRIPLLPGITLKEIKPSLALTWTPE